MGDGTAVGLKKTASLIEKETPPPPPPEGDKQMAFI